MRLFDRTYTITVVRQPTGFIGSNPAFFESIGNAIEIVDHRVRFEVKKNLGKQPNSCKIIITNLAETTRADLEQKPMGVTLAAGYDGAPRLLFTGDMIDSFSRIVGADWETTIFVGDGMRAFAHARMDRSYKPPIEVSRVLEDAAKSMGLDLPPEIEQSAELRQALANGISTHGPTRDVLTRVLAPYGYGWSVQNGQLQILRDDQSRAGEALIVDIESGLVGSPEWSPPQRPSSGKKPGKKARRGPEIKFDVLMYPEIVPGRLVRLDSRASDWVFRVHDADTDGDSASGPWTTSVKARPL